MDKEFEIIQNIYTDIEKIDENGTKYLKEVCTKRDAVFKWYCPDLSTITDVRQVLSLRGKEIKDKCVIRSSSCQEWVTVRGSYDEIRLLVSEARKKSKPTIGFNQINH